MIAGNFNLVLRRFVRNRLAAVGLAILLIEFAAGIFAPLIAPHDPVNQTLSDRLLPPGEGGYILGTDDIGRDLLSRIIFGARISLIEGLATSAIVLTVSIPLGSIAAYYPRLDNPIMRVIDVLLAFPALLLALLVVGILGTNFVNVIIAVGFAGIPPATVFTRGLVLSAKNNEYVVAARSIGARDRTIIFRHILPNIIPPIIVATTFRAATAILAIAGLSFLGLGAQPPTPEWGAMLSNGRGYLYTSPHIATFPGIAILITVLGYNLVGDGLREAIDPRLRVR